MIRVITVIWLQNNDSRSLCNWTDNLITFFKINKFRTRKSQTIWYTGYLSLLFSVAWVEVKANSTCRLSCFFSFFFHFFSQLILRLLHPYCNSLACLAVLFLKIISKTIWYCIIAFFDRLIRKHVTYAMYTNAMATCLEY